MDSVTIRVNYNRWRSTTPDLSDPLLCILAARILKETQDWAAVDSHF